jgi:hypothetical protein
MLALACLGASCSKLDSSPTAAAAPLFPVNATFASGVVLQGVDLSAVPIQLGKPFSVTAHFKVNQPIDGSWQLFFHANDCGTTEFHDLGAAGSTPPAQWKSGEDVRVTAQTTLPLGYPRSDVSLYVGFFRGADRMDIVSGPKDNFHRARMATVPVQGAAPASPVPRSYVARRTRVAPKIDGVLDEGVWTNAPVSEYLIDPVTAGAAANVGTFRALWDDQNLYFAVDNVDRDLIATTQKQEMFPHDDFVQVFVDPRGNGVFYSRYFVTASGATGDALNTATGLSDFGWTSHMKAGVKLNGTINRSEDEDRGWTVEIAVPLADLNLTAPPKMGDRWRMNVARADIDKFSNTISTVWAPPMTADFDVPSHFGTLLFGDENGNTVLPAGVTAPQRTQPKARKGLHGALSQPRSE